MVVWGVRADGRRLAAVVRHHAVRRAPRTDAATPREQHWAADPVVPTRERLQYAQRSTWAEPPFVPPPDRDERKENYWMMSQRAAHAFAITSFAAGLSLALYAVFYVACDVWGWQLGLFRTLGTNALVGYILHGMVDDAVSPFIPRDSPGWYVTAGFLLLLRHHVAVHPPPGEERYLPEAVEAGSRRHVRATDRQRPTRELTIVASVARFQRLLRRPRPLWRSIVRGIYLRRDPLAVHLAALASRRRSSRRRLLHGFDHRPGSVNTRRSVSRISRAGGDGLQLFVVVAAVDDQVAHAGLGVGDGLQVHVSFFRRSSHPV